MKKIYICEDKINIINENYVSPDSFEYHGEYFSANDSDAITFIYNLKNNEFYSLYNGTHWALKKEIALKKLGYDDYSQVMDYLSDESEKTGESIDDLEEDFYNEISRVTSDIVKDSVEGRAWLKNQFLAFWGDIQPIEVVNEVIKNIERDFNCSFERPTIIIGGKIIPYEEYNQNINVNIDVDNEYRAIHLMNQKDKRDRLSDFRKTRDIKNSNKLGNMTMAQYHNLIYQEEKKITENYETEVEPNEIDMSSFKIQKKLNPDIWDGDVLNSRVRLKLLDITDDFVNYIGVRWVKPIDIVLTGSICNYNWSKFSDIDVHIIIDFSKVSDKEDLVREYFNLKKNEWNNDHNLLEIYGFNVEFYIENINDKTESDGIYSLEKNKWLKKPDYQAMHDIDGDDDNKIREVASKIMTKIDNAIELSEKLVDKHKLSRLNKKIDKLLTKIRKYRKESLTLEGELSIGNIVYKILRRTEYLDKLWNLKIFIYDKINSIK